MAYTGQTEVDELRLILQETDPLNSRWTDPQLLQYMLRGRRTYAEDSKAVKALFEQLIPAGPTALGGNRYARYPLDPATLDIDAARYDALPLNIEGEGGWDAKLNFQGPDALGTPYMIVRRGASIDLFFAPASANKVLEYIASVIPADIALVDPDQELTDQQVRVAIDYAAAEALTDDGRDGTIYLNRAQSRAREHKKRLNRNGPQYVNQSIGG